MENTKVRELMRPIEDFPSISGELSLFEAMEALERVQEDYRTGKAPEIILLVRGKSGAVQGKISPMDIVKGLEPNYFQFGKEEHFPFDNIVMDAVEAMRSQVRLWQQPLSELCRKAWAVKIESFIEMPPREQMVDIDDCLPTAFDLFVITRQGSLFVVDGRNVVGIIRFSDIYNKIKEVMRSCPIPE
jgi:ferredoxin